MNNLPRLFTFRRCPYAIRARMALALASIAYEKIEVSLRAKPPELLALSPKGTVPVLVLQNGQVIDQSLDIMRWALAQPSAQLNAPHWLTPPDDSETALWLKRCDVDFKPLLDRYKYPQRHPEAEQPSYRQQALEAFILPLNERLKHSSTVLGASSSDRPTWVDVALFPFVRQFAAVDNAWFEVQDWPALKSWLSSWLNSDSFLLVMQK
jgi:glutathione S-transferase